MGPIRILIADDHTFVRQGLTSLLAADDDCEIVAEAINGLEAVEMAIKNRPQIAVLDITMPKLNGMDAIRRIKKALPACRILILTMHEEEEYVLHMVKAGASGYLVKDSASSELVFAIKQLASGKSYFGPYAASVLAEQYQKPAEEWEDPYSRLTEREREVFHQILDGKTTKEIARELAISPKTAENHRGKVMEKLKVDNLVELVKYAAKKGLIV